MSDVWAILEQAIQRRTRVRAVYRGLPCEICPQALGWKGNEMRVIALQLGGVAGPRTPPARMGVTHWSCLSVEELNDVRSTEGAWFVLPLPSRTTSWMDKIILRARSPIPRRFSRAGQDRRSELSDFSPAVERTSHPADMMRAVDERPSMPSAHEANP